MDWLVGAQHKVGEEAEHQELHRKHTEAPKNVDFINQWIESNRLRFVDLVDFVDCVFGGSRKLTYRVAVIYILSLKRGKGKEMSKVQEDLRISCISK